jgi:ribosome-associated protein
MESETHDDLDEEGPPRPSKSQLKRDSTDLQDLGATLIGLSRDQLAKLDLPEELLQAVLAGQSLKHDGSLKRQRKFIGKLLRQTDPEPIRAGLAEFTRVSAAAARSLHRIEAWRDRILAEGDPAINELMVEHPQAERPKLRQLADAARRERERGEPPRSARLLFKYLRELFAVD